MKMNFLWLDEEENMEFITESRCYASGLNVIKLFLT